jgi:uncharacterized SAM-binding protein YcdF (DUF218 family)
MDDGFFYASKLIWLVASPSSLFLILMIVSVVLLFAGYQVIARRLLATLTALLLFIAVFPVGSWLLYPLEARFDSNPSLPADIDGIIILGGSVMPQQSEAWGQLETNQFAERLIAGVSLSRRYPSARVVFTGGSASIFPGRPTEADMVRDYFVEEGISEQRLVMEKLARNTAENASFSKKLIDPKAGEKWVLVTTAFHMPRSIGLFCQQNWPVIPYPVDHDTVPDRLFQARFNVADHASTLDTAAHEWAGLLAYYLTGRIDSLLPSACGD